MKKKTKVISLIILFILISTFNPTYKSQTTSFFFPLKNIEIQNNKLIKKKNISSALESLKGSNLLFLDQKKIKKNLLQFDSFSGFKIKKIYPNSIKIKIFEKKPVAIHVKNNKKFYIVEEGHLIDFVDNEDSSRFPVVFGKIINFNLFFNELKKNNFYNNQIKSFHYYEIGRWDLTLKNNRTLKLPKFKYQEALKNYDKIKNNKSFDKYKTFDYRIKDQLILK
jgi:cell division protein FtsQ|tara:strand:+ start:227 stop:895 length:669 start_codon:yes stop_codon:yes gene_type:complete